MSISQKLKKPSKQLNTQTIKPNLPNSCLQKHDAENSSQPPRKHMSDGNSLQPSKKLKMQSSETTTVAGKAATESVQLTNYMSTLIHAAPTPIPQKTELNDAEMSFLEDVSEGSSQKDNEEPVLDDDDNESVENGEEN
ncbi:hypothetical protein BT96DRAFT_1005950 [Gymnopus androsaceus JB14]|uniref:Uncharacterized protein n=1 Tax=Gymnopus androsaceus JB14 TaxID=1447944 RepID=A0A6A4GML8_9AGAR|nr:hypothetical protein BT96DRAFT_1005950 [Gymnopus androsaceus JB14]